MLYKFHKHCPPEPPQSCAHQSQSLHTVATCASEPIIAELKPTTYIKKQADLYLQRHELDRDFACSSVPFCSVHLNWLLWINETKQVQTESVPVWGDPKDNKVESEAVDVRV